MWLKRIGLILLLNLAVIFTVNIITNLFNLDPYLSSKGIHFKNLAIFCFIWGMTGSLISLFLSKQMAKWIYGLKIISQSEIRVDYQELWKIVERVSRKAGLVEVPEVGIWEGEEMNAFATGPSASHSLVAVSSGLIKKMDKEALEGVIAHEISHITNGDMVTMTLLQGVINSFVMFLSRILAYALARSSKNNDEAPSPMTYMMLTMLFECVFMFLGAMVVAAFSRWREFRADALAGDLVGKHSMIHALESLQKEVYQGQSKEEPSYQVLQISTRRVSWLALLATHPPLEERINKLKNKI